jgi:hypothetical protein
MSKTPKIPEGYRQDAQGRLVPLETIKEVDLQRDALVKGVVAKAKEMSGQLALFRAAVMDQIQAFVAESAEKFGVKIGGAKGNITLLSFDGALKVVFAVNDFISFDERLQVAKQLVDKCIRKWSEGSRPEIIALVNDAFDVDKTGRVSAGKILALRRLDIEDKDWRKAMDAIGQSLTVVRTKSYVRVYERDEHGEYQPIALDVAGV